MARADVRAEEQVEIRKTGERRAEIRLRPLLRVPASSAVLDGPLTHHCSVTVRPCELANSQLAPRSDEHAPADVDANAASACVKACSQDEDIDLVLLARFAADALLRDRVDAVGDELDIGQVERLEVARVADLQASVRPRQRRREGIARS